MSETRPEEAEISKRHIKIINELGVLSARHVRQHKNLVLLDPEQVDLSHHHSGTPLPYEEMYDKAAEAFPDFPEIMERLDHICEEADELTASTKPRREMNPLRLAAGHLERGENVIFATDHYDHTDIVKLFTAACVWLGRNGYGHVVNNKGKVKRAVVASQITSVTGVKMKNHYAKEGEPQIITVPVPYALLAVAHEVIKVYPNAPSVAKIRELWEAETVLNNRQSRSTIGGLQKDGSLFMAVAPSGTQDKHLPGDPTTYQLGTVPMGALDWMKYPNTFTLFMGYWQDEAGNPILQFNGKEINGLWIPDGPVAIKNRDQGHHEMTNLSATLNHWVPHRHFIYVPYKTRGHDAARGEGY